MPVTIDELQVDVTQPTAVAPAETASTQGEALRASELDTLLAERARIAARLIAD